jgi:hypothetical protein
VKRLAQIEARRLALRAEMHQTRVGIGLSIGRVRGWLAPAATAFAVGRALSGRPWLRLAAIGALAAAAVLRVAGRR